MNISMTMKQHNIVRILLVCMAMLCGWGQAWADLKPTVVVNEDFDEGATLFTGVSRMTVSNDNNAKFTTANNSTNDYSNATYDFDTEGAVAVRIEYDYWIANAACNYDVAFIVRDKDVSAGHMKQAMGLEGAFISIGRSRQSSANFFSINRERTAAASATNLGFWCHANIYIDVIEKKIDYTVSNLETGAVIKAETGRAFASNTAKAVSQIDFFACVNDESDYLDNLVITKYEDEKVYPKAEFPYAQELLITGHSLTRTVKTNSDGAVTYSSSNPTVATVDPVTGEVTGVAAGNATITAFLDESSLFFSGSASYELTVKDEYDPGDELILADIDFSDSFSNGEVSGRINKITMVGTSFEKGYNGILTDVLRVGNGTGTVTVDNTGIESLDAVTISFDLYFGNLNNRYAGIDLLDAAGNRIGGFYHSKYSNSTEYDDFGLDWSQIKAIGSSSAANDAICVDGNKTHFTITLDYATSGMSIVAVSGGVSQEHSVAMTNTNLLTSFVLKSNYDNVDRRCWFDNLEIKTIKGDYSKVPADYTIKYQTEDGTKIKEDAVRRGISGETVVLNSSDKDNFYTSDKSKKYIYVSDNSSEVTINKNGSSVVTVIFREAAKYDYRLTTTVVTDAVLPSGTTFEGEAVLVFYPRFILDKNKRLYSTEPDAEKQYAVTFLPDKDDYEYVMDYKYAGVSNVELLREGEDVPGMTRLKTSGHHTRTSNGATGYSAGDVVIATGLPSGQYVLTMIPYNGTNNNTSYYFKVLIGDDTVMSFYNNTNGLGSNTSAEFGVKDESIELVMPAGFAGDDNCAIDNFYLQRVGDFIGAPTITRNLLSSYNVMQNHSTTITVQATHAANYQWYIWTGLVSEYESAVSAYLNGTGQEPSTLASAQEIDGENSSSYSYNADKEVGHVDLLFCKIKGYDTNQYSLLATVTTIKEIADLESTMVPFYNQTYEKTSGTGWMGTASAAIASEGFDHFVQLTNTGNGFRAEYLPLAEEFVHAPSNDGTWSLDFDFQLSANNPGELSIYNSAYGVPISNAVVPNDNALFALKINGTNYDIYVNGKLKASALTFDYATWYHANLLVNRSAQTVTVAITQGKARADLFSGSEIEPSDKDMGLGGIHTYFLHNTNPVNFDNIVLKVNTYELLVNSDLSDFYEGNDDYYLEDGAGLNFDVPAATTFEWYVSEVAPSVNPTSGNPLLKADGSISWEGHEPFMTVVTPVDRASTVIKETKGEELATSGKHAVEPSADNEGKYAWGLQQTYGHVQTVWDEATKDTINGKDICRYYPEATVSGSRWHYLRQLTNDETEEHADYVWCVASNALGEVTSKVAHIVTYRLAPQIFLTDEYETEDNDGERADMTLPGIYKFKNYTAKITANNLIFGTENMPVPYTTVSTIQYLDESSNAYTVRIEDGKPVWKNGDTEWTGVSSTTVFTSLDASLEQNSSVHGFYKDLPTTEIDFTYGQMQTLSNGSISYHEITSDTKRHGGAQYIIGPIDNVAQQGTQTLYSDFGRYAETPLGEVSEKTTWDWSKLPEREFLTYNLQYAPDANKLTLGGTTYVIDPETGLGGPVMGNEYVMADFYGYKPGELGSFPSDKVAIGLEYVNEPTDHCMQGNAFIFKPTVAGTLTVRFSSTNSNAKRYLELCSRSNMLDADVTKTAYDGEDNVSGGDQVIKELTMTITDDMVGGDKVIVIRARNCAGEEPNGLTDQYFRIYSATYTPNTASVTAKEYVADEKADIQAADTYTVVETPAFGVNGLGNTDGFVSLHAADGAKIKYKLYVGNATTDEITAALNGIGASDLKSDIEALETLDYNPETYTDTKGNKIGIHVRVNSTIIAWAEMPGMNNSLPLVYKTHAATYPVDLRFMYNFTKKPEPSEKNAIDTFFNETYWGTGDDIKARETEYARKAWNASDYADVEIDGLPYTAANFDKFFITHGTVIDISVMAKGKYQFDGFGAPAVGKVGGDGADKDLYTINDMMRARAATKYARYHLLYDKAKAKNTDYIAFLIANFKDLEGKFTAQILMKEGTDAQTDPTYTSSVIVDDENEIVAPKYHSAHDYDGLTVTMWTEDHSARDADNIITSRDDEIYISYLPGETAKIYENTYIKAVYRENTTADNYRSRSQDMKAEWWFTIDHYAQPLTVKNEYPGFNMPYVTPVLRSEIGTAEKGADDDLWFDLPMTITPGTIGRVDNTAITDWCTMGRGVRFTVPVCPNAEVSMEVRSKLSLTTGGTTFGGEFPELWKVKYKGDTEYTVTNTPEAGKTVESYIYKYVCPADWSSDNLDIVLGNDYSYLRHIGLMMPVANHNRDAALITLNFEDLARLSVTPYGEGRTGDGYEFKSGEKASLYKTHYSKEEGAIYYKGVSNIVPQNSIADNVPYVNGYKGFSYSTAEDGTFIVGPFRSITHIRYLQGCSVIGGGGWTMTVGRKTLTEGRGNYTVDSFSDVQWSDAKYGSIHNTTTPEWVEMDIEENIGIEKINSPEYDEIKGDIFLRFQADKPNVYLFAIEIYGIDPAPQQQVMLETGVLATEKEEDTRFEPSLRAGSIFHFPYLLELDEDYKPVTELSGTGNKRMQYNEGREVTLTANANLGYEFLKWVKPDGTGGWEEVSTENPYTFNIDNDTEMRAVFVHRGIINYITSGTNYGLAPEMQQTDRQGGFAVAENRGMYNAEGMSLRQWQDAEPLHEWYEGDGKDVSTLYDVSTNHINSSATGNVTTESYVTKSRAATGIQVDVFPQFSVNTLSLLDVTGRKGATARWQFGKKNGAPTMSGKGTTSHLVTQMAIEAFKDEVDPDDGSVITTPVNDMIDVKMDVNAAINNAGRADAYATVGGTGIAGESFATFTLSATKGMLIEIGAGGSIQYRVNGGEWTDYTEAFHFYSPLTTCKLELRNATDAAQTIELEYIQATYYQRAQTPVLSMQKVDVIGPGATNDVQVQVQTNSNKNAVRFYTTDGSDPQYEVIGNEIKPVGSTRQVRGNYITINQTQIGSGTTLKVISVCPDRADSEIATLDLEPYNSDLGLATYVYDSRFIDIHEDQIFKKLMADHEGHFNLLSYDLNPAAAQIPATITDHTTVFVASDAVRDHLMKALTDPTDPAAHGQTFSVSPLIVGTPLTVSWKESVGEGSWNPISWVAQDNEGNPIYTVNSATPTSPATITYTEWLRGMKKAHTRDDDSKTYEKYYRDNGQIAEDDPYILAFYDNMLLDGNKLCISTTTSNAPEYLSANGTQLVFNATELLTRITEDAEGHRTPANVSTFNSTLLALMGPSKDPQVVNIAMTYTQDVIDLPDSPYWTKLDAPMLSALSDGKTEMSMPYLASAYPQFRADALQNYGKVEVKNVEVAAASDDLSKVEKLGAQGVKDLATIIELTNPAKDPTFKRTYRIEYNIPLEEITFRKEGDKWVNSEGNNLWTLEESKGADGSTPFYKITAPQNFGIKNLCFNGYAVAPEVNFDANGEIRGDVNADGTPMYSIWGRGEKYNLDDAFPCPTSYNVIAPMIPEFPASVDEGERYGLSGNQWMIAEFPWGYKDCDRMAFSLLNIEEYKGEIKVQFYRRQAESPKLISAYVGGENTEDSHIKDGMVVDPSGQFTLEFNSVMHQVRKPGKYADLDVDWTVHIIPDSLAPGVRYSEIKDNFRQIDQYDTQAIQQMLTADGGSNVLTFYYWRLEEGKKYWLHIPFHILRGAVGTGTPYELPAETAGTPEEHMSWTNYEGTDGKKVPFFDIPFTVKKKDNKHQVFDYIVNNDSWWNAYKEAESPTCAGDLPDYATWDGNFSKGINAIKSLVDGHNRFYMHIQKNKDAYSYAGEDEYGHQGLIQINASNFSIIGEGSDSTVVTAKPDAYGNDALYSGLNENNNESTLHLDGSKIYIQDITLQNTQQGSNIDGQEYPALFDHGDRNIYYGVNIDGYEESFAVFGTLSYLEKCRVSGFGDFVVGSGDVWLDSCEIVLRDRENINLCAPSTKATDPWGFVFNGCTIDREAGASKVLDHNWTLARPWKGYDVDVLKSPSVNFINTDFKVLPTQGGYGALDDGLRLRFHEYGSQQNGLGLLLTTRSIANCNPDAASDYPVITAEQATAYTVENVFGHGTTNGYDPQSFTKQAEAPVLVNDGMVLHWNNDSKNLCYLVYYLGDGEVPDWEHAMMFCCVPGTDEEEAYCYLTNHDLSPIFRTGKTDRPVSFSEMWYGKRKVNGADEAYNDKDLIPGMGKDSPSRLWFSVRAANQMGGLSPMSNALMYHAARQYRTTIKEGGKLWGDDSGNAFSTIYLDFQARAPKGVKAYALTKVSTTAGEGTAETTLTFTRMSSGTDPNHQDVVYADQGYLIYGPYQTADNKAQTEMNHVFIETTALPENDLDSHLSGSVGEFLDRVSEPGYGENNGVNDLIGWSINPGDYEDLPRVNVSAYTLQRYNNTLGFYKFTGANFQHHRAYLDTETATRLLVVQEGMSEDDAQRHLARGMRIVIQEEEGIEMDITSVFLPAQETIYDVTGTQVSRQQMIRGHIYIVDGQKVLWK